VRRRTEPTALRAGEWLSLVLVLLCARVLPVFSQSPAVPVHLSLRLLELSLVADSSYGLQLLVEPHSGSAASEHPLIWLRLDPDSALAWLNSAAAVLRSPVPGGPPEAIQWSSTLRPVNGRGGFLLGRHRRKGALQKEHWLAIADSAPGWQAEIGAKDADSLLRLFLVVAPQAGIDSSPRAAADQDHVDRPAMLIQQAKAAGRSGSGHVAAQYIVGTDGQVEAETLRILLVSAPRLEAQTREIILASHFDPAQRSGRVVRQLVQQVLVFR
jgi:hypothetical protein